MKTSRKFHDGKAYTSSNDSYYLLPFRFHVLDASTEVLVNEVGDYLIVERGTAHRIVERKIPHNDPLYADLLANFFVSETPIPDLIDVLATRYRTKKSFLDSFTSLHILVLTLRCDHSCQYCQVSRQSEDGFQYDMSKRVLDKAIELVFMSPSEDLTIEFQGGEPLLSFDLLVYAVERIKSINLKARRQITFVLCSNLSRLNRDILSFCGVNNILISTSLDGPAFLHNANRPRSGVPSHELALNGIAMCREVLGDDRVSALMTTSSLSLAHPIEIVEEYVARGFMSIFLRPLNPFGYARKARRSDVDEAKKFLEFYKAALGRVIEYNLKGIHLVEEYATIILTKILTPFPVGFVDLQSPNGIINSVVLYNYDGYVYVSDEARMLAEEGDYSFRLGHVERDSYGDMFYGERAREIAQVWANEGLPGCSECGFQAYCGADPVRNHATQGDMVGFRPNNSFCTKNMGIIAHLFELMRANKQIEQLFRSWVGKRTYETSC